MSFTNKVVLITGGSSGIGAATAIEFAKEGANVAIVGRNEAKLKKVCEKIQKYTNNFLVINADVGKKDEVTTLVKKTIDKFGKLDVLVNNAATFKFGSILDGKLFDVYEETMDTNLRAPVILTALAAPYLIETKGNIVNISSAFSTLVSKVPQNILYSVSKAGLDHFTRCSALELAPSGVRVNAINPGPVKTDIIENAGFTPEEAERLRKDYEMKVPLKKTGDPEEIAALVLFLASDKAKSITGSLYFSDNGACLG